MAISLKPLFGEKMNHASSTRPPGECVSSLLLQRAEGNDIGVEGGQERERERESRDNVRDVYRDTHTPRQGNEQQTSAPLVVPAEEACNKCQR